MVQCKNILIQELYLDNKDELLRAENDAIVAHIHDEKCLNSNKAWNGINTIDENENMKKIRNHTSVQCCCGSTYIGLCNKQQHEKSKKHLSWLKDNIQTEETL